MSNFNDWVQQELPKRPFSEADGTAGQVPVRSNNPLAPREVVWVDQSTIAGGGGGAGPGSGAGTQIEMEAGENLVQGDPVYVAVGKLYKADNVTNYNVVGLIEVAVLMGSTAIAKTSGLVQLTALTPDSTYFLGGGSMTLNSPNSGRVIKMGRALSSTSFLLSIGGSVLLA